MYIYEGGHYKRLFSQCPAYFAGVWVQGGLWTIKYDNPVSTYHVGVWVLTMVNSSMLLMILLQDNVA